MTYCGDDGDMTGWELGTEYVPNLADDDFYMFVYGNWHESLINKEETQGYIADYERRLAEMTDEATEYMDDYQMVLSFIEKWNAGD